jgi:hypothetical protein
LTLHNNRRHRIVPAEGRAVLFDYGNMNCLMSAPRLSAGERALSHAFFDSGEQGEAVSVQWASDIADAVRILANRHCSELGTQPDGESL